MDETWIHHFTPKMKEQSKQWTERRESASKKVKTVPSAGKVMASVFWDAREIIFIEYLHKGKTINSEYYTNLLQRLRDEIKKKRPHLTKKKVLFNQDDVLIHTSVIAMPKINEVKFKLLLHTSYSPKLANNEKLEVSRSSTVFTINRVLKLLNIRGEKCIQLKGDYVEK